MRNTCVYKVRIVSGYNNVVIGYLADRSPCLRGSRIVYQSLRSNFTQNTLLTISDNILRITFTYRLFIELNSSECRGAIIITGIEIGRIFEGIRTGIVFIQFNQFLEVARVNLSHLSAISSLFE